MPSRRPPGALARLALLGACLALGACAINPALRIADAVPPGTGPVLLDDVPFHPQLAYQCGPAALAGVLGASGVAATPDALAPQVFLPGREGSLQVELQAAARRAGRVPYRVAPTAQALFAELAAGRPVLVLQNLLTRSVPKWHYAVLVGLDPASNRVVLNSGTEQGARVGARTFMRTWDWGGRWGLVALRPGELPAAAEPAAYLTAVADFEAVAGAEAAAPAYRAALDRWPDDARPRLALGNHLHSGGDLAGAAAEYRAGLDRAPGDVVLANNLASVLGALGCPDEGRAVLAPVLAGSTADDRWHAVLLDTAVELEVARASGGADCAAYR